MKIGLVVDHFDPARGGVETWTYQLAEQLLKLGHQLHIVAETFKHGLSTRPEGTAGLVWHRLPAGTSRIERGQAAESILRKLNLDVVHDMGVGWYCDVFHPHGGSRTAAFRQNLQFVSSWLRPLKQLASHVLPRYREFDAMLERQYSGDHLVIALSEMVRRDIRRYHGLGDDRIRLVYNGVNIERFSINDRSKYREPVREELGVTDQVLHLIVAHNYRLKGVPALLRAMSLLKERDEDVHLAVVGGKPSRRFQKMARKLAVHGHVSFVGASDEIARYYAAADVYVQPTFYDPCSLVVLEALGCGLPVITSRFNGASELMQEGQHGYVVDDPADSEVLAEQMAKLSDQQVRTELGQQCRELALQHTFAQNVDNIVAVYQEVIDGRMGENRPNRAAA